MAWSLKDIEENLLGSAINVLGLSAQEAQDAVNRVEQVLGPSWIAGNIAGKGIAPAMQAISMGLRLPALDGVPDTARLVDKLRGNQDNADAELTALWLLRSIDPAAEVVLEPPVGNRKADFRIHRQGEPGITVEVTSPQTSQEEQRIRGIMERLTTAFESATNTFSLDIVLRREPSTEELELLWQRLPQFTSLGGPQRATLIDSMGWLFLNQTPVGTWLGCEVPEMSDTPMVGLVMFKGGGPTGGPLYQVAVQIPFAETRAERFLRDKAGQLPGDGPGLVMIQASRSPRGFKAWATLFKKALNCIRDTRISAVCLFCGEAGPTGDGYNWQPRATLVVNPSAQWRLPEPFASGLALMSVMSEGAAAGGPRPPSDSRGNAVFQGDRHR